MSLAVALTPIAIVFGQNQSLGVEILQVTLASNVSVYNGQSQYNGTVGQAFNLQGEIYQSNGSYQVILGQNVVATGISVGYYVNTNFTVPAIPGGSYDLTLNDVATKVNSTGATPESFLVLTGYTMDAIPSQTQEGSSVTLTVSVTGGDANAAYAANVSVELPSPLNTEYSTIVSMGTSNQDGTAIGQVTYPNSSFQPINSINSTTDYVGTYNVYFNQSGSLAQSQFSIGFLDSTTYHRGQTATIGATGYEPNQAAALSIINDATGTTVDSQSLTASADGIINATWVVPSNAAIGDYNLTITPTAFESVCAWNQADVFQTCERGGGWWRGWRRHCRQRTRYGWTECCAFGTRQMVWALRRPQRRPAQPAHLCLGEFVGPDEQRTLHV